MVTLETALDAETAVLGAILIEPSLMGRAILGLKDSDFQGKHNRIIWQSMKRLWTEGTPADPVLVLEKVNPALENARDYIMQLMELVPSCDGFDNYLEAMTRQSAILQIRDLAASMQEAQTLEEMQQLIAKASAAVLTKQARNRMDAKQMVESFAADHATHQKPHFLPWSMAKLRKNMDMETGDLCYIAGRPSDGKTAFAIQEAWFQAKTERVGFYSLETGYKKIRDRSMANLIMVDRDRIKHNRMTQEDWDRYAMAAGQLTERKIHVIEASGWTVEEIRADAVSHNYTTVYIDYLQLIVPPDARQQNRVLAIGDISRELKAFGRQTGIKICCICSMSRTGTEGDHARRPVNTDLRESGQLEFDADAILFIWRENPNNSNSQRHIYVSKNKEGTTGEFPVFFDGKHQLISDKEIPEKPPIYENASFAPITEPDDQLPFDK